MARVRRRHFIVFGAGALASLGCGSGGESKLDPAEAPLPAAAPAATEGVDTVVLGGTILTFDPKHPQVEALAITGGVVVAVGTSDEIAAMQGNHTRVVDLGGGLAVPGLTDAHGHVTGLGRNLEEVDLRGAKSIEEVVSRVKQHGGKGDWIVGRGWDQNLWPDAAMPTHQALTAAFPDRPVWLRRVDGHAGWGNAALLRQAGISVDAGTPQVPATPEGGEILLDDAGVPTGVLIDAAMDLVPVPEPSPRDIKRWILAAQDHLHQRGITGVHDMGVDAATDKIYRQLASTGQLKLRIHGYASEQWFEKELLGSREPDVSQASTRYALIGVKVYADGALGSRGAYMLAPYSDRAGHRGLMQRSEKSLSKLATDAMGANWQMATHAIGDGGNRATLDAYEMAYQRHRKDDHRFRIEHCQIVSPADISRFTTLKVVASMQPTHATSDMPWVPARIGPQRLKGAYAWNRFLKAGVHLSFGSDFPVELPDVTHGLYAAITREDPSGEPEGGWLPEQRVTLERALRGFTVEPAYAARREAHLGTLAKGMQGDVTCFKDDLRSLEPGEVREAQILATVVAGEIMAPAP